MAKGVSTSEEGAAVREYNIPRGLLISLGILSLIFLFLGFVRSENALIHTFDTGIYLQILNNLWEGRGFASSVTGESNFLAHHFQPVVALLMPFFKIWPSAFSLLFVSWVCIFLSAIYLAYSLPSQNIASQASATFVALSMFLHPTLTSRIYYSFVPEIMALPFLCYAALFLEKKSIDRRSAILLLFALLFVSLCKETLWLTSAFVLILLAFKHRKISLGKVFAAFALLFTGVFLFLFLKWMPEHTSLSTYYGMTYYANPSVGDQFGFLGKVLGAILNVFSVESLWTLMIVVILLPLGFVLFGGYYSLLGASPALFLILASRSSQIHDLTNHYLIGALPFLAVSSAIGFDRLKTLWLNQVGREKLRSYLSALIVLVPLTITLFHNSGFIFQSFFAKERLTPGYREAAEALKIGQDPSELTLIDGSLQPLFPELFQTKIILGFQGNPTRVTREDLAQATRVITANDLEEIKDCRSLKAGEGDLSLFHYEEFYVFCDWLKTAPLAKKVIIPGRLVEFKRIQE